MDLRLADELRQRVGSLFTPSRDPTRPNDPTVEQVRKAIRDAVSAHPNSIHLQGIEDELEYRLSKEYLARHNTGRFLESLLAHVVKTKSNAPIDEMIRLLDAIAGGTSAT